MSDIRSSEIMSEQRYLDRVYARLAELRLTAAEVEKAGYRLSSVGTFGAYVERDAMVFHAARRRHALDAEHEGLVFGRLDLGAGQASSEHRSPTEPAIPGGEVRYIGRLGLRDDNYEPLVIDWRAPAAAAFYRATPTDRMGVVRRRTIRSSGERVLEVDDDLLDPAGAPEDMPVIGDGALIASLAKATTSGMRDIVATIQREQDEAIRSPAAAVTVVRGGPGTGKTAVALHRAAYLLYADRNRFESGGVLVIGPSSVFVSYVSRVLPSLGEETVSMRSLGELVSGHSAERHDTPELAAIKGSVRMARVLARAARSGVPDAPRQLRLLYRGTLLVLNGQALDEIRRNLLSQHGKRNAVRAKAAGYVLDALWRQANEVLPSSQRRKRPEFAEEIAERSEFITFMRAWWPILRPADVLTWLRDPQRLRRYADGIFSHADINAMITAGASEDGPLTVADIALLDELDDLLGRAPVKVKPAAQAFMVGGVAEVTTYADRVAAARQAHRRPLDDADYREYAHIVVDEAQDVSPMQWRMIGRRGEYASWTIVGDPAQSAWTDAAEAQRAMDAALGTRRRNEYVLATNYRNASEIFALAAKVIRRAEPGLELPTAVRSSGVEPRHRTVPASELPQAVVDEAKALLAEVPGTVGVITAMADRQLVAEWLHSHADERLQIVDSLSAKGMEYDGVLVFEPSHIRAEGRNGVRTLYVALSRATQRLSTVGSDDAWFA